MKPSRRGSQDRIATFDVPRSFDLKIQLPGGTGFCQPVNYGYLQDVCARRQTVQQNVCRVGHTLHVGQSFSRYLMQRRGNYRFVLAKDLCLDSEIGESAVGAGGNCLSSITRVCVGGAHRGVVDEGEKTQRRRTGESMIHVDDDTL